MIGAKMIRRPLGASRRWNVEQQRPGTFQAAIERARPAVQSVEPRPEVHAWKRVQGKVVRQILQFTVSASSTSQRMAAAV